MSAPVDEAASDPDLDFPERGPDEPARGEGRCAVHPERPSAFTCARCGSFGCYDCQSIRDETRCVTCMRSTLDETSATYISIGAVVLGFLGMGFPPAGWLGIALGAVDLAWSTSNGRTAGRTLSILGIVLGVLGTAVWALAIYRAMNEVLEGM